MNKNNLKLSPFFLYFFRKSAWVGMRQTITMITSLTLSIAFARLISQEVYGQYQLILSFLSLVSIASIPGLNTSIIRSTARKFDGDYKKAVNISFKWSVFFGIPAILLFGAYYLIRDNPIGYIFFLVAPFFPFLYAPNTWDSFFQGKERFDIAAKFTIIRSVLSTIFLVSIIFIFRDNLLLIVLAYLILNSFFNTFFYHKSKKYISNEREDKETISYGWFVTKINTLSLLASNLDKLIIATFIGPAALAVYAIGTTFSKKILNFFKNFLAIATPTIARKNTVSLKYYSIIFLLSSIVSIALYFLFPIIIPFFFSEKYTSSVELSQIIIIFLPLYIINTLYSNHFLFYKKNKKVLALNSILSPTIKIILMIPLLYFFDIKGLAFLVGFQNIINILTLVVINKTQSVTFNTASKP